MFKTLLLRGFQLFRGFQLLRSQPIGHSVQDSIYAKNKTRLRQTDRTRKFGVKNSYFIVLLTEKVLVLSRAISMLV